MNRPTDRELERVVRWLETATSAVNHHDLAPAVLARLRTLPPPRPGLTGWWLRQSPEWQAVPVAASLCLLVVTAWLLTAAHQVVPTDLLVDPDAVLDLVTGTGWLGGGP